MDLSVQALKRSYSQLNMEEFWNYEIQMSLIYRRLDFKKRRLGINVSIIRNLTCVFTGVNETKDREFRLKILVNIRVA